MVTLAEPLTVIGDESSHEVLTLEDVPEGTVYAFVRVDLVDNLNAPGVCSIALSTSEGTSGNGGGGQLTLDAPDYRASTYVFDRVAGGSTVTLIVNAGATGSGVSVHRAFLCVAPDL